MRFIVTPELAGERLDRGVATLSGLPRRRVRALADAGHLWLSGRAVQVLSRKLQTGDLVDLVPPEGASLLPGSPPPPVLLLHEDGWLVAMDKPSGMASQAPRRRTAGELSAHEALTLHLSWREGKRVEPGLFHRLDRITSGVLLFARHHEAAKALTRTWSAGDADKRYLTVVCGRPGEEELHITQPISRDSLVPGRFCVADRGRPATTVVRLLASMGDLALLEVQPRTGRTHQVRVHLAWAGLPVAGDTLYGGAAAVPRPLLHAWRLTIPHPRDGQPFRLEAPLPADFQAVLASRGFDPSTLPI